MKKAFRVIVICIFIAALAVSVFSCSKDPYVTATMTVRDDGTFKILQLTDLHFINSDLEGKSKTKDNLYLRDEWAMTCITDVITKADPDLIVLTGDIVYNLDEYVGVIEGFNSDNEASFKKVTNFIDGFNIPWTFVFGNHDEEGSLKKKYKNDKEATKRALADYLLSDNLKNCLYANGPDDINGVSNHIITVENKDGSLNNALVMLDSGSFFGTEAWYYDWVHDDQLDWYEKAIKHLAFKHLTTHKNIKSVIFQHIPFNEYGDVLQTFIQELEAKGEDWHNTIKVDGKERTITISEDKTISYPLFYNEKQIRTVNVKAGESITYHFGVYNEGEVCASFIGKWKGSTYDGGNEFKRLVDFGSAQAVFCGHDHRNTYSFTYKGLRITYGMSVDYSASGLLPRQDVFADTEQRGGTLITLNADSSLKVEQVPFTTDLYGAEVAKRGK